MRRYRPIHAGPQQKALRYNRFVDDALLPLSSTAERVLTIAELNRSARQILESNFPLLWVGGEISNVTHAASGHVYFSLKDDAAQVRCVMFRSRAQLLPFRLADGMRVETRALVTLYEARGDFQLNVETLRRAGIGALYEAFARLRERLAAEGLFDARHKRALPRYPGAVGVVTSPQAAALRDVLAALRRRSPHVPVIVYPVPVQGDGAAAKIADMLRLAGERREADVLILTRGGGSIEDLWAFNEEIVARALRACALPVVCGVGHEPDVTIADFAADQRAATPTAAAELVSAGYFESVERLEWLRQHLQRGMRHAQEARMQRVDLLAHRLVHPGERLRHDRQRLEHLRQRLRTATTLRVRAAADALNQLNLRLARRQPQLKQMQERLTHLKHRMNAAVQATCQRRRAALEAIVTHLAHLNPQAVLGRGYSLVRDANGNIVHSSAQVETGAELHVQFGTGWAKSKVTQKG